MQVLTFCRNLPLPSSRAESPLDDGFSKMLILINKPTECHISVDCIINEAFVEYFHIPSNSTIFITDSLHITVVMSKSNAKQHFPNNSAYKG